MDNWWFRMELERMRHAEEKRECDHHGDYRLGWSVVMGLILAIAVAASVYLIYVLEILKFRRRRARQLKRQDPQTSEHQIDQQVSRDIETGEFERVG